MCEIQVMYIDYSSQKYRISLYKWKIENLLELCNQPKIWKVSYYWSKKCFLKISSKSDIGKVLFQILSPNETQDSVEILTNFWKVPSQRRILMKFAGNISFINSMILSKFQVDCITPTDFRFFTYIGKFDISGWISAHEKCRNFFSFQYFWKISFDLCSLY